MKKIIKRKQVFLRINHILLIKFQTNRNNMELKRQTTPLGKSLYDNAKELKKNQIINIKKIKMKLYQKLIQIIHINKNIVNEKQNNIDNNNININLLDKFFILLIIHIFYFQ